MVAPDDPLRALLGVPELEWLVERMRARLASGRPLRGVVTLERPTDAQRQGADALFGRAPSRGAVLRVSLDGLEAILRHAGLCPDLPAAVTALCGPVEDRGVTEAAWEAVWRETLHRVEGNDALVRWLVQLRASGLLRRLSGPRPDNARVLLEGALRVAALLPAEAMTLAELAARAAGDSHALDVGAPLGTLCVPLAECLAGHAPEEGADRRRDTWASVGVLVDELSAPVLVLNLPGDADSLTGRGLALHAEAGEPCRLSVRQLLRHPPRFALEGVKVFICENPAVVAAAAERLGARCAPLVCTDGAPRTACRVLLQQLVVAGARLNAHADMDWAGVTFTNLLMRRHGAAPWRMGSDDYRRAPGGPRLVGSAVAASWDETLMPAMAARGTAVQEEQVLEGLMGDLGG